MATAHARHNQRGGQPVAVAVMPNSKKDKKHCIFAKIILEKRETPEEKLRKTTN